MSQCASAVSLLWLQYLTGICTCCFKHTVCLKTQHLPFKAKMHDLNALFQQAQQQIMHHTAVCYSPPEKQLQAGLRGVLLAFPYEYNLVGKACRLHRQAPTWGWSRPNCRTLEAFHTICPTAFSLNAGDRLLQPANLRYLIRAAQGCQDAPVLVCLQGRLIHKLTT